MKVVVSVVPSFVFNFHFPELNHYDFNYIYTFHVYFVFFRSYFDYIHEHLSMLILLFYVCLSLCSSFFVFQNYFKDGFDKVHAYFDCMLKRSWLHTCLDHLVRRQDVSETVCHVDWKTGYMERWVHTGEN